MAILFKYAVFRQCKYSGIWKEVCEFFPKVEKVYMFGKFGSWFGNFFLADIYTYTSDESLRIDAAECALTNMKDINNNSVIIEWHNTVDGEHWWFVDVIWRNGKWV